MKKRPAKRTTLSSSGSSLRKIFIQYGLSPDRVIRFIDMHLDTDSTEDDNLYKEAASKLEQYRAKLITHEAYLLKQLLKKK